MRIQTTKKIYFLRLIKASLEKLINIFIKLIFKINQNYYRVIISEAFYSPWYNDENFLIIFEKFKKLTMLNDQRAYSIYSAINNIKNLQGNLIEVGMWKGGISFLMAEKLKNIESKKKVISFDTFEGVIKSSDKDTFYENGEHNDTDMSEVLKKKGEFKLNNINIYKGIFPENFKNNNEVKELTKLICMAHIDVDTYKSAEDTMLEIWPKIVSGGIVIFDDYGFHQADGIRKFVDNFKNLNQCIHFYNQNGQAIIIKR